MDLRISWSRFGLRSACDGPGPFPTGRCLPSGCRKLVKAATRNGSRTVNIPEAAQPVFLGRIPFSGSDAEGPSAAAQTTPLSYSTLAPVAGTGFDGLYSG